MEQDKNYMGYMNNMPCFGMENMPPYMYGKCMNMDNMSYNNKFMPCMENNMPNCYGRNDMYMNPYMMKNLEPIENMCGNTYKILIVYVRKTMNSIIMENMGMMPKTISKDSLNKYINDMLCDVMKNIDEIERMLLDQRSETEEEINDRKACPLCNSMLKDTLTILLVTELLKGGCSSCY